MQSHYTTYALSSRGDQMSNFNNARRNGTGGQEWYAEKITQLFSSRPVPRKSNRKVAR